MALGGGKVEGGVEAAEGGGPREARVHVQQLPHLRRVAVACRRRHPLPERRAAHRIPHYIILITKLYLYYLLTYFNHTINNPTNKKKKKEEEE